MRRELGPLGFWLRALHVPGFGLGVTASYSYGVSTLECSLGPWVLMASVWRAEGR